MAKRFSEFNSCNIEKSDVEKLAKENNINLNNVENSINKYSNYSEDELMNEFLKVTKERKSKGEINAEEIENLKNTLYPMLTEEQKARFNYLIKFMM